MSTNNQLISMDNSQISNNFYYQDNISRSSEKLDFFQEVSGRNSAIAFFLGLAIVGAPIFLGRSYAFYISVLIFSFIMTLFWRKAPRPWIFLASMSAAAPAPIFRQNVACNLIFALWFTVFNLRYLSRLPKWIYPLTGLLIFGLFTSSINWIADNPIRNIMRQTAFAYNFILAPFILIPMIYFRMAGSRDNDANLKGLLFCLIVPSTLVLVSAKLFGKVSNLWEASLHVSTLAEGFFVYALGKVPVNFLRTEVGFILAALICASTAIAVSQVKTRYRLLAGACLASNAFLLLSTASFGSGLACLCGLAAIFHVQFRVINPAKVLTSIAVIVCMALLTYIALPASIKGYLGKRYEHRVTDADQDRVALWTRAIDYFSEHPEGVGFTMTVGEKVKTNPHNDYLVYALSYGFMGGLAYLSLVAGLLISFFRRPKNKINDPSALAICLAGLGVIVAVAVNSMTDHMLENRWYFNAIWSVVWYCYFCSRATPEEKALNG